MPLLHKLMHERVCRKNNIEMRQMLLQMGNPFRIVRNIRQRDDAAAGEKKGGKREPEHPDSFPCGEGIFPCAGFLRAAGHYYEPAAACERPLDCGDMAFVQGLEPAGKQSCLEFLHKEKEWRLRLNS